ncbi:Ubiquinone/menaquinone biosynthesis C-methylase UbiE [Salinibacillus kushneri]|uniref:Ubiquinone/menaquinone biosynthesis C-methylase UbiE n=1 Tax=Salinibacillus kushneri TaxID=237682 RepID=A0A1I0F480_9BACI|nr:class I SAM-dependent methyltransferase [Salinibacillus kushneri]SET52457.1 Ubiquinone/menaquinone biosynthesis C-methylase UbiE [Salinibacillus kushneri]
MGIDFHSNKNRFKYADRHADSTWMETITNLVPIEPITSAVDIGCGGGIYSKALLESGVDTVIGIDFSQAMLEGAKEKAQGDQNLTFKFGNAYETGLEGNNHDLVLERALIHHIKDLDACFEEAYRILDDNGLLIIQDRTPEDCFLEGTISHIRGYFFECFPRLKEIEMKRRHKSSSVIVKLKKAGFRYIEEVKLWETRKVYKNKQQLLQDVKGRSGRSILYELTDQELNRILNFIDQELPVNDKIIEKDRWTIWKAVK